MTRSHLSIPDAGPCARHPCDVCRTCQRGRCCRADDPDYRKPGLGEWAGPIYVALGVTESPDGVLLTCHACGGAFESVGQHAVSAHDLTAAEYRSIFGLTGKQSLAGPAYRARRSAWNLKRLQSLDAMPVPPVATPEQRSARAVAAHAGRRSTGRKILFSGAGGQYPESARITISNAKRGQPKSDEHRKRIADGVRRYYQQRQEDKP